ncbi:MAG: aldolase [Halobacteriota archaeon]|nr:aldolase [Halobacteriota archaeon]
MIEDLKRFGKRLARDGLVKSNSGNISIRVGDKIFITTSGSMLDELDEESIVEIDPDSSKFDLKASSESLVHSKIYKKTNSSAVIHAHPTFAVVLSLLMDGPVEPMDFEGKYFFEEIPIIKSDTGSKELAEDVSTTIKKRNGLIVRGHGTFTTGKNVEEAYLRTCAIEFSCRILYHYRLS